MEQIITECARETRRFLWGSNAGMNNDAFVGSWLKGTLLPARTKDQVMGAINRCFIGGGYSPNQEQADAIVALLEKDHLTLKELFLLGMMTFVKKEKINEDKNTSTDTDKKEN